MSSTEFKTVEQNGTCSLSNCEHLSLLSSMIMKYTECINSNKPYIINDSNYILSVLNQFLHLLDNHNDDVETIMYKLGVCDIANCKIFARNYRNRSKLTDNSQALHELYDQSIQDTIYHQLLDKIHCFYAHCHDLGNRLLLTEQQSLSEVKIHEDHITNARMIKMNQILTEKRKIYTSFEGIIINFKKYDQLSVEESKQNDIVFQYGQLFKYGDDDPYSFDHTKRVYPKYSSLKEELIENKIASINIQQYQNEYGKAKVHYDSYYRKQYYSEMSVEYILSLMIYCNFDVLSYQFSKTYRENIEAHNNFYFMAKYLKYAVFHFGTEVSSGNIEEFYHGISTPLLFPYLFNDVYDGVDIYCPLSTSSSYHVACNFTNYNQGLVVTFGSGSTNYCVYFPCSWLSDYGNEFECLFIQNITKFGGKGVYIKNITNTNTGCTFDTIVNALNIISNPSQHQDKQKDSIYELALALIHNQLSHKSQQYLPFESLDEYGQKLVDTFCQNKIEMKLDYSNKSKYTNIFEIICDTKHEWIKMNVIDALYPNIQQIDTQNVNLSNHILNNIFLYLQDQSNVLQSLHTVSIKPKMKSTLSVVSVLKQYSTKFREMNVFLHCINDVLYVNRCSIYTFAVKVIESLGRAMYEDVDESISKILSKLLNAQFSNKLLDLATSVNDNVVLQFGERCIQKKQIAMEWTDLFMPIISNHRSSLFKMLYHLEYHWIKIESFTALFPNATEIAIWSPILSSSVIENIIKFFGNTNINSKLKSIAIWNPTKRSTLSISDAVMQYEQQFKQINITTKTNNKPDSNTTYLVFRRK